MKPYFPLIILAVASDDKVIYKKLREVYESIIDVSKEVKIYLVYGSPITFTPKKFDLYFPEIEESPYPGMALKTIKAMEHVLAEYNFDFLLRTNISTIWLLDRILTRIKTMPKNNTYTGTRRRCYINGKLSVNYISGTSLIVSRDLVDKIVKNKYKIVEQDLPEDFAISNFIQSELDLEPVAPSLKPMHLLEHLTEFSVPFIEEELKKADHLNCDHFRIKSKTNREAIDPYVAGYIVNRYYNINNA